MSVIKCVLLVLICFWFGSAQGRVFSFGNEWLASYFRATGATSSLLTEGFRYSSGADTVFTKEAGITYSGEFGFLVNMGEKLNFRVGIEALQGKTPTESYGNNSSGAKRFDLDHKVLIINTVATLEFNYMHSPTWRLFVGAGAGLSSVSMDNQYTMTALGTADLGTSSYTEKSEANVVSMHLSTGVEVLFVDAVTAMFEIGYRYLPVDELTHKTSETVIGESGSSKAVTKGGPVLNHDGSKRAFDMSGVYAGISFRFYIPL